MFCASLAKSLPPATMASAFGERCPASQPVRPSGGQQQRSARLGPYRIRVLPLCRRRTLEQHAGYNGGRRRGKLLDHCCTTDRNGVRHEYEW